VCEKRVKLEIEQPNGEGEILPRTRGRIPPNGLMLRQETKFPLVNTRESGLSPDVGQIALSGQKFLFKLHFSGAKYSQANRTQGSLGCKRSPVKF